MAHSLEPHTMTEEDSEDIKEIIKPLPEGEYKVNAIGVVDVSATTSEPHTMLEEDSEDIKEIIKPLPEREYKANAIAAVHGFAVTSEEKPVANSILTTNDSDIHKNIEDNCLMDANKMEKQSDLSSTIFPSKESAEATLLEAAMKDDVPTAKKALDAGANPDCNSWLGKTPLHCATVANHYSMVSLLLEAGASVEKKDQDGWTALHYAAFKNCIDCASLLLDKGACPNTRNWLGKTPLRIALENNQLVVASLIKTRGGQDSCIML